MKLPEYFLDDVQQCVNVGLNGFALQLVAESFADKPELFGDHNLVMRLHAHNGQEVWMIVTKTRPTAADFDKEQPCPAK